MLECSHVGTTMKQMIILLITLTFVRAKPAEPVQVADELVYTANNTYFTADYDIVDVHFPVRINQTLNYNRVFLVQADTKNNIYKGTYVVNFESIRLGKNRNATARKLLENGKCITSDSERVYFGTTTGIYTYNFSNEEVEKYGSITADIRDIEKDVTKDLIYIVTEQNKLYLVTENGNKMVEHDTIRNVHEIASDGNGTLYFYEKHVDLEKHLKFFEKYSKPKVLVGDNVVNISGLQDTYSNIKLLSLWDFEKAILILDGKLHEIFSDGTSKEQPYVFLDMPTAFSVQAKLIQFYGHDRKLYCFIVNIAPIVEGIVKMIAESISQYHFKQD